MDTALVMQLGEVMAQMRQRLREIGDILSGLADAHRGTPIAARTLLQQALPTTFGAKCAGWLMPVIRHMQRLDALRPRLLVIQLGGAAGTRAALGGAGDLVSRALALELGLDPAPMPWHTARDCLSEFAALCGLISGTLGKIAQDVALLMQTEIGEVLEGAAPGKGGSSTLPHKRNPVATHAMLAIARLTPGLVGTMMATQVQAHERAVGDWPAEWAVLPDLVSHTGASLNHALAMLPALDIRSEAMRANLDVTQGLIMAESVMMALAQHVGRGAAHHVVELASRDAARQKRHLAEILAADPAVTTYLDAATLTALTAPEAYLGDAVAFADAGVALWGRHLAGAG
jgi:3-carboxy-cis,cis-muconate cycloisomerase